MGKIYKRVKLFLRLVQVLCSPGSSTKEEEADKAILHTFGAMRELLRGANISPLSGAIHQDQFPERFHNESDVLPKFKIGPRRVTATHKDVKIAFPVFSEPAPGTKGTGEDGVRRII
jgi:hypothetical protein